ncbi:MAG: RIP metalloprotease RseP [Rickettsiales bacterium]|nr:RIP metalloprotease RseP [Rickettsiales bacterium]
MEFLTQTAHTLGSFIIVLSVIVFIHEFGHYIVAKWCGVKVEIFSIGFGKELCGFTDRSGTRWKISALPVGGYVKMYGDSSEASTTDAETLEQLSDEQKSLTFHHKPLYKKALIVVAGPTSNFLLTITMLTYFIMTTGLPSIQPVVGEVIKDSAAEEAGLKAGDRIVQINDEKVSRFSDIAYLISTNLGTAVTLHVERGNKVNLVTLTPKEFEDDDGLGNKIKRPLIGIRATEIKIEDVGPVVAVQEAVRRTYLICTTTLTAIGQMITGQRGVHDLQGPVGIAKLSGQAADKDAHTVLWLIAMLSANLGLVNLFPIPLLDGGHLAYYGVEAIRGRPMAQKMQEYGFRLGFIILSSLMLLTLFNDIRKLL